MLSTLFSSTCSLLFTFGHNLGDYFIFFLQKSCNFSSRAVELAGTCDGKGYRKFELALTRNSWKIRTQKLLESAEKPTIQQMQRLLKEGLAISIPPEDYYRQQLSALRDFGLRWENTAKKVSKDGGALRFTASVEDLTTREQFLLVINAMNGIISIA
ncbi:unnamed protein product [Fraxinus pennsylvanica]|uniref:Uncharacterized protein n=1 Tax=Fraxinus pennsylvanica TaxID=56036 RepID=A0AAD2DTA3_9LAMI|nr:unnamed protein product [Fraxinus pennsylvanica]